MKKKITILTPTFNSQNVINRLINCLNNQTDKNFNWVVIDNLSTDQTIRLIRKSINSQIDYKIYSDSDNGIFDAINKGLSKLETDYYLILGADDLIFKNTISKLNNILSSNNKIDIIFSAFFYKDKLYFPRRNFGWLYGITGLGSSHCVGTLIKKKLHDIFGMYNTEFPIAADQLFIQSVVLSDTNIYRDKIPNGTFTEGGFSSQKLKFYLELFEIQIRLGRNYLTQLLLLFLRLFKYYFIK
jgi:glycosyltransferase involved in cell wall biosynthesis